VTMIVNVKYEECRTFPPNPNHKHNPNSNPNPNTNPTIPNPTYPILNSNPNRAW